MEPRELTRNWVSAFNRADSEAMAELYAKDAVNHQLIWEPLVGRELSFLRQQGLSLPAE